MDTPALPGWAADANATLPLSAASSVFARLRELPLSLRRRAPPLDDPSRWRAHRIGERTYRVAQPITFTPYAAATPCSARCRFCSENLRSIEGGTAASLLRPQTDYFDALRGALQQLHGLPLSYSLSGLETTDDHAWCIALLQTLDAAARSGVPVAERVLYSNGAGFAHAGGDALIDALVDFDLSWLELSRHHHDEARNRAIMRFRAHEAIDANPMFEVVAQRLSARLRLRFVCIVQQGGVADADDVDAYLRWAAALGAGIVIFREFSRLGEGYRDNGTRRYLEATRVSIETLIESCMRSPMWSQLTPLGLTEGYYFWNLRMRHSSGIEIVFESSDYTAMQERHASGDLYKLVFHANGRLCAGWSPDRDVLWNATDA
jgi:hypothetical protein